MADMTHEEVSPYFGKRVLVTTRPISPSREEGHYEGVIEKIDNDPQHVYLQPLTASAPLPPYRRHGPGARTHAIPVNEIRSVQLL
jgi:hypothetical protein